MRQERRGLRDGSDVLVASDGDQHDVRIGPLRADLEVVLDYFLGHDVACSSNRHSTVVDPAVAQTGL